MRGAELMNMHRELVGELSALRKGRGVFAARIGERVGPHLRVMCGISGDDQPAAIRGKLVARLVELAEQLPQDLRLATVAAFALGTEVRLPLYRDRLLWAAAKIDRDPRTVRRRVDDAIDQLAELAAVVPSAPRGAWHTAELHVVVALDRLEPEVLEQYRIVADQDALHELDLPSPLAAPARRFLQADAFYGGWLRDRGTASRDSGGLALVLPQPLSQGEPHEFAVRFRLSNSQAIRSYLVHLPGHSCGQFELRVRFGRGWTPLHVWTLRDVRQDTAFNPLNHGHQHPVGPTGEVHLRFRRLLPGLGYGARWESEDQHTAAEPALPLNGTEQLHMAAHRL
jgi:hypothetical protein